MKKNLANSNNSRVIFGGLTTEIHFDNKGMTIRARRGANIVPANHVKEFTDAATKLQDNELKNQVRAAQAVYELYKQIGSDVKSLLTNPATIADIAKIGDTIKAVKATRTEVENYDPESNEFEPVK